MGYILLLNVCHCVFQSTDKADNDRDYPSSRSCEQLPEWAASVASVGLDNPAADPCSTSDDHVHNHSTPGSRTGGPDQHDELFNLQCSGSSITKAECESSFFQLEETSLQDGRGDGRGESPFPIALHLGSAVTTSDEEDLGMWDRESVLTDRSVDTDSVSMTTTKSFSAGSESSSVKRTPRKSNSRISVLSEGRGLKALKARRKRKRNRYVDIEDIVVEIDPDRERIWLEYEEKKRAFLADQCIVNGDNFSAEHSNVLTVSNQIVDNSDRTGALAGEETLDSNRINESEDTAMQSVISGDVGVRDMIAIDHPDVISSGPIELSVDLVPRTTTGWQRSSIEEEVDGITADPEPPDSPGLVRPPGPQPQLLVMHRLPGERLGMGLSVESTGDENDPVKGVFVERVSPGGAADRATGAERGICLGDEILEINGSPLKDASYSETIAFFRQMPLRIMVLVKRGDPNEVFSSRDKDSDALVRVTSHSSGSSVHLDTTLNRSSSTEMSSNFTVHDRHQLHDPQHHHDKHHLGDVPGGYHSVQISFHKDPDRSLGLQLVPSFHSPSQYYEVSYILFLLLTL